MAFIDNLNLTTFPQFYNPAQIALNGKNDFGLAFNKSHTRIDGVPKEYIGVFTYNINEKFAIGFAENYSTIGVWRNNTLQTQARYKFELKNSQKLNLGFQIGYNRINFNFDPLPNSVKNGRIFMRLGILYDKQNFRFGITSPFLISRDIFDLENETIPKLATNILINSSYLIKISEHIDLQPQFLLNLSDFGSIQFALQAIINKQIFIGVDYRLFDKLTFQGKFRISNKIDLIANYSLENINRFGFGAKYYF